MKGMLKFAAICSLLVLPVATASAQDGTPGPGADIYKAKCAKCHGEDGQAHTLAGRMTKAADLKSPMVTGSSDADLIGVVTNGKKKMPAFGKKLSEDQIKSVVAYVRSLSPPPSGTHPGM
jgi:mono/diheme cytochrome c family protein